MRGEPRGAKRRPLPERRGTQINLIEAGGEAMLEKFHFPADGDYKLRVKAYGRGALGVVPRMAFEVDGKPFGEEAVSADTKTAKFYEATCRVAAGNHKVAAPVRQPLNG